MNQELVQEMERVRSELEKTKFELEEKDRKSSTETDSDVRKQSTGFLIIVMFLCRHLETN